MPLTLEQQQYIEAAFTQIARNAFKRLKEISLADHAMNPFLVVLVARTPEDLADFIVNQRVERGLVTSLGTQLQKVAREVGTVMHSSGVPGADLEGQHSALQRHLLMQVKSGPDTVNLDISERIRENLNQAERRIRGGGLPKGWSVEKMLGMCYGQLKDRNGFVLKLGSGGVDVTKIGRDFWEFITDDPNAYEEVFEVARSVATTYKNTSGKPLAQAIEDAKASLTRQIESLYGDGKGGFDWVKLLNDNM